MMAEALHLSRLFINAGCKSAYRDLTYAYEMHRTVMRAFPDRFDGRVLFRLEPPRTAPWFTLYVQSVVPADWSFLLNIEGYLARSPVANPGQKQFVPAFRSGERLVFRLRANPTVKRGGKRLALFRESDQLAWLKRKLESAGAVLLDARTSAESWHRFTDNDHREAAVYGVTFDGVLEVGNPESLSKAVKDGIGSAKGFGFGLLSLARPR